MSSVSEIHLQNNTIISDYFKLLKPRVMSLVVFTGVVGMYLAPGQINFAIALIAIFCIALGSGAAGAINMWYERETDALMSRTKNRPIPAGRIPAENAIEFAVICAVASVYIMAIAVNYVAAICLLVAILFYVFIYTIWLKPRTPMNIVIGGAAGALPPVIGWAAVTGSVSIEPIILFTIIFMWTPPHFWALALYKNGDYSKAGIPMLPAVKGKNNTRKQMLIYTLLLLPITVTPYFLGMSELVYLVGSAILAIGFILHAFRVYIKKTDKDAKAMFLYSILHLFGIFWLLVIDKVLYA